MPENKRIYEDSFKKAHSDAFAQAKKKMPAANASEILKLLVQLFESSDREAALKKLTAEYGEAAAVYAKVFSEDFIKRTIEEALKNSDRTEFQKLAEDRFSETLVKSAKSVMMILAAYARKEIDEEEFILRLGQAGIGEIGTKLMKAFDIDPGKFADHPEELLRLTGPALAYQGFMGAYKEYSKALSDLKLAREERILIEEQCNETIEMIREYRQLMEERVSAYMTKRLETFDAGFRAMDQAILDNDPEGFISGNVQIQKILGYDTQFTSFDEFDSLMESDMDFKL